MRWRPRSFALFGFLGIVLILYYVEYFMRHNVIKLQPEYGASPRLDSTALYLCEPLPPWFGSPDTNGSLELCPQANILTVEQGLFRGRFGNQMWEYASVWALAKETPSLSPFIPHCLRRVLDDAFPNLSIPELVEQPQESCEPEPVQSSTREEVMAMLKSSNRSRNIVLRRWIALQELVLPRIHELREQDFRFHPELERGTHLILSSAARTLYGAHFDPSRVTYVGVHVRRTDYVSYLTRSDPASQPAGADYYRAAMEWFRGRLSPHVAFLIVSDDLSWCRDNLVKPWKDVFLVLRDGRDAPQADLALMAACNHSVLDYGTFGVWGALLAGGETLVYRQSGSVKSHAEEVVRMVPHWQLFP